MLAGDTAVACVRNMFRPEEIELQGGGGTDMAALVVAAAEERPAPKAILVVTDGYTGWPRKSVGPRGFGLPDASPHCRTRAETAWYCRPEPKRLNSPVSPVIPTTARRSA